MISRSLDNCNERNTGFTLVELVVCITILSIASVVLMKSFSMAAMTNGKAQRMQSATSLAESVMEEVKSSGIKQLQKKYNGGADVSVAITQADTTYDDIADAALASVTDPAPGAVSEKLLTGGTATTPYYVLVKKGVTSTRGEKFDVTATMRTKPYSGTLGSDDASDANSLKLPVIEEIDAHTKTVLSAKELNKYDGAAYDYFREHTVVDGKLKLESKEIVIKKEGTGGNSPTDVITVKCEVVYTADDEDPVTPPVNYSKEVFSGTYVPQKGKDGNMQPVGNDIYIFYNRYLDTGEKFTITDTTTNADGHHKVYIIFQKDMHKTIKEDDDTDMDDLSGTEINIIGEGGANIPASVNSDINYSDGSETIYGRAKSGDYWLITNLPQSPGLGSKGSMLEKKAKNRVFEVTVRVNKAGSSEVDTSMTSTIDVKE